MIAGSIVEKYIYGLRRDVPEYIIKGVENGGKPVINTSTMSSILILVR